LRKFQGKRINALLADYLESAYNVDTLKTDCLKSRISVVFRQENAIIFRIETGFMEWKGSCFETEFPNNPL